MEYVLETKLLCKEYKNYKALKNLNMKVPKGSIYGFIGKNGSGKTTLIRLITSLQKPTSGEYSLFGINSQTKIISKARKRIGAVVETPSIYMDMTAKENLKTQYTTIGMPSFDGINELLKLVGLENTGNKKAKNFSLGMRQRLGIAIALVGNPDLLILDEPINGLDPQGIIEIRELILKLNREKGITVLISSHILDELSKIATHYGVIDNGRIIKEFSTKSLENLCKKKIIVTVTNITKFVVVLDRLKVKYKIIDNKTAEIYDEVTVTKLVEESSKEKCEIITINNHGENLETYFINLVGGSANE